VLKAAGMVKLSTLRFDASKLRQVREHRRLMQSEAAEQLGLSRQRLNNYEQGKTQPDPTTLLRMVTFYEIDLRDLSNRRIAA